MSEETLSRARDRALELTQLIAAYRAAYEAFIKAIDEYEDDPDHPIVSAASDAQDDALFELCSYHCKSIEEAGTKAAYLLTTAEVAGDALQPEHLKALLESFVAA